MDVVEHGSRGIAPVGNMKRAVGKLPREPGVDGAEGELAARGARACAAHIVEQPLELGRREISVDHEPRPALDVAAHAGLQSFAFFESYLNKPHTWSGSMS
jgi:hypothetical protein